MLTENENIRAMVVFLDQDGVPESNAMERIEFGSSPALSSSTSSSSPIASSVFHVPQKLQLMKKEMPDATARQNHREIKKASIEERSSANGTNGYNFNKEEKPGYKKEKEKKNAQQHPSTLTADDLTAIRTVQYACLWYLFVTLGAVFLHLTEQNLGGETSFELTRNRILAKIAKILAATNNSFNFCFYMRAKSFRATFRERWF